MLAGPEIPHVNPQPQLPPCGDFRRTMALAERSAAQLARQSGGLGVANRSRRKASGLPACDGFVPAGEGLRRSHGPADLSVTALAGLPADFGSS